VASAVAEWQPGDRGSQVIARARILVSAAAPPTARAATDVAAVALDGAAPAPREVELIEPPEFEPEPLSPRRDK